MLIKCTRYNCIDLDKLLNIYTQTVGELNFRNVCNFSDDLHLFFECKGAFLAQWVVGGEAVAAMRVEPYRDGYLISCLETAPQYRRKGYASALIRAVISDTPGSYYTHVDKKNKPSLRLHKNLGFQIHLDHAIYIDGSVYTNSFTLKK